MEQNDKTQLNVHKVVTFKFLFWEFKRKVEFIVDIDWFNRSYQYNTSQSEIIK